MWVWSAHCTGGGGSTPGVPSPQFHSQRATGVLSGSLDVGCTVQVRLTQETRKLAVGGASATVTVTMPRSKGGLPSQEIR